MNRWLVVTAIAALSAGYAWAQDSVVEVPANVMKEMIRTKVDPVYPPSAISNRVGGVVALHAIIDKYGQITKLDVIKGPEELRASALDAVRQWTFVPYLANQQSTAVSTTILIQYAPMVVGVDVTRDGKVQHYGPAKPGPEVFILSEDPSAGVVGMGPMAGVMGPGAGLHAPTKIPKDIQPMSGGGSAPFPAGPARISGGVSAGNILSRVSPEYPPVARAAHVGGAVVLRALISEDGSIETLSVISGPPMLVKAAMDAVEQWKWKPFMLNGKPTKVDTTVTVNFNLQP
jgi:TonB family protein